MARIVVIGQSGTGKSWGAGAVIERVLDPSHPENPGKTFDLAVHFDPEDEERGLSADGHDPLYRRLDVTYRQAAAINWPKLIYKYKQVRVVPDMKEEEMAEIYGQISGAVFRLCKDIVPELSAFVSADEAGQYVTQHGADDRVLSTQSRGRKYGVETCHIIQRPQQINSEIISQTDRRILFRINDDNDLGKIAKQVGFNVNRLKTLEDRHCIIENNSSGDHVVECTEDWTRMRPHYAQDDGIADAALPV